MERGLYQSAALYNQAAQNLKEATREKDVTKDYEDQVRKMSKAEVYCFSLFLDEMADPL